MTSLHTAEDVSRFLRSKEPVGQIVAVATDLVGGKIDVLFPQKELFVLELICDRLNSTNNQWRSRKEVWLLLADIWNSIEPRHRNVFKRIRLVDVLFLVLTDSKKDELDSQLMEPMFAFVELLLKNVFLEVDENVFMRVLGAYVTFLESPSFQNQFSLTVHQLFNIMVNSDYVPSKKIVTKFVQELLIKVCGYLDAHPEDKTTSNLFLNILEMFLLSEDSLPQTITELGKLQNKKNKNIDKNSLTYFFDLMASKTSERDFKTLEDAYKAMVSAEPDIAEALLSILSKKNKSLSGEFIGEVYSQNIAAQQKNWGLLIYLLEIDNELAINNAESLLNVFEQVSDDVIVERFRNAFVGSFVKGRELPSFYKNIWFAHRNEDSWRSSSLIQLVAKYSHDLTANQTKEILNFCFEQGINTTLPLIASVVGGLLTSPRTKPQALQTVLVDTSSIFDEDLKAKSKQDIQSLWQIRYGILCLYSENVFEGIKQSLVQLIRNSAVSNMYYYFTLFRIVELFDVRNEFDFQTGFLQFITAPGTEELYDSLFLRWPVMINFAFLKSQIEKILDITHKQLGFTKLQQIIAYNSDVLFELKNISDVIIKLVLSEISQERTTASCIELLAVIPEECIDHRDYAKLIDNLQRLSSDKSITVVCASQMNRLLSNPMLTLKFERSYEQMLTFILNCDSHSDELALPVLRKIWRTFFARYREFHLHIDTSIKSLISTIKSNFQSLQMALIFLSLKKDVKDPELKSLLGDLEHAYILLLEEHMLEISLTKKINDLGVLNWLLKSLLEADHSEPEKVRRAVVKLGNVISTKEDDQYDETKIILFKLVSHWAQPHLKNAIYIAALYIALKSTRELNLENALQEYLTRFCAHAEREQFELLAYYVADSVSLASENQLPHIISLLVQLSYTIKHRDEATQKVFTVILSQIINVIDKLDAEILIEVLKTIKAELSERTWLFKQYTTELTLLIVSNVAHQLSINAMDPEALEELYVLVSQVFSHLLLFHRFKFQSRHHILIRAMIDLLEPLTVKKHNKILATSSECARAYARLVANLCEPPATNSYKELADSSLTTSSTIIKKGLRKYLPMLLVSYISFNLKYNFDSSINDELLQAMYTVFNVLTERELQLVNSTLDFPGKSFYRSLYANYKDQGKWKDN